MELVKHQVGKLHSFFLCPEYDACDVTPNNRRLSTRCHGCHVCEVTTKQNGIVEVE